MNPEVSILPSGDPVEVVYTPDIFTFQRVGGISRYYVELASHLHAAGHRPSLVAGLHRNLYVRTRPRITTGVYLPFGIGPLHPARVAANNLLCRWIVARHPRAVVHQTFYGKTIPMGTRPLVITVYDLIEALLGDRFPRMRPWRDAAVARQRSLCARADHIVAISETTRQDLIRVFGIASDKVTTIQLGNSALAPRDSPAKPGVKYLLYVGSRLDYKNFEALLEAYGRSDLLRRRFQLVCFGGGTWTEGERQRIAALDLTGRVLQRSGDDESLGRAYRGATAFVYPSLYEGFGLPLLEAMSQDCPVLCARAGSLPEVAADAAGYFDPESIESIQATLEGVLADETRLTALREAGRQRVRLFSWERCARETAEVYRRLAA